jgi:hypothetical protein
MFIVHSIGSDEGNPFKAFGSKGDAVKYAEQRCYQDVERVFVYEWNGDLEDGLAGARKGQLEPIAHYSHREVPRTPSPERPIRVSQETQEFVAELVKKLPRMARKF